MTRNHSNECIDWETVERIISDLKNDGYEVHSFESNTSHAAPTKQFWLKVERDD